MQSKKIPKKLFIVTLAVLMLISLGFGACGNDGGGNTSSGNTAVGGGSDAAVSGGAEGGQFTVGMNTFVIGDFALDTITATGKKAYEALGIEVVETNDEANVDKAISNVENLISQGVDAIDYWPINDACAVKVSQLCLAAEIPFIIRDGFPTDPAVIEEITNNPYFIGHFGVDSFYAGRSIAQYVIDAGHKRGIISGVDRGQVTQEGRINGFKSLCEENGIEIVMEVRPSAASSEEMQSQTEDLLVSNQDVDFWYSSHFANVTLGTSMYNQLGLTMPVYITDLNPTSIEGLKAGTYQVVNGGQWVVGVWTAGLVYNHLIGHPILDENGKAPVNDSLKQILVTADTADLANKYFLQQDPYPAEYIQNLCFDKNPDISYQYYADEINNFSLETLLLMKRDAGIVSDDELKAAGIIQ